MSELAQEEVAKSALGPRYVKTLLGSSLAHQSLTAIMKMLSLHSSSLLQEMVIHRYACHLVMVKTGHSRLSTRILTRHNRQAQMLKHASIG